MPDAERAKAEGALLSFFLPSLSAGGAERVLMAVAGAVAERGFRCDLVTAQGGGRWQDRVPEGVRLVALDRRKPLHAVPGLARYLRRERPVALLASVFAANIAALLACAATGTRCVVREAYRAEEDAKSAGMLAALGNRLALRLLYRRADAVVALSPGLAEHIAQTAHVAPGKVVVIPNPHLARAGGGDAPAREPDLVLACGRLEPQKDFATLLRAFAMVRGERAARLVVLGEGSQLGLLRGLAEALGIAADVLFAGYAADAGAWMRRARLLVSTSRFEGFPNVLLEGLANGCRVVSTNSSDAVPDLLDGGRLGTIVPVGDVEAVARAIAGALATDAPAMDPAGLERRYGLQAIVDQYLDVLLAGRQYPGAPSRMAS